MFAITAVGCWVEFQKEGAAWDQIDPKLVHPDVGLIVASVGFVVACATTVSACCTKPRDDRYDTLA